MNIAVFLQLILIPIMPITEMSSTSWLLYFTLFALKSATFQGHLLISFSFQDHKKGIRIFFFSNLRSFYDQSDPLLKIHTIQKEHNKPQTSTHNPFPKDCHSNRLLYSLPEL